jgi:ubiquinol-cytochrome c reductase cytochrome b subunit
LALMAEAFFGYLLPWGQMSYWGAQVIVNLFSTVPVIGDALGTWIRGDYTISDVTLNRFFAFHVALLPLVLLALAAAHLMALHEVGSNNPDGIEIKNQPKDPKTGIYLDGIYSHPYYTVQDLVGIVFFLIIFAIVVFFLPDVGGYFLESNNFIPADPLKTPEHIAPVWYFTPYYAMLRAVPSFLNSQFWGVLVMGAGVVVFFFLPWLDRGAVKSIRYRGTLYKTWLAVFVVCFLVLGYLGTVSVTVWGQFSGGWTEALDTKDRATWLARLLTIVYFLFFVLMPWYTARDKTKPVPERVRW